MNKINETERNSKSISKHIIYIGVIIIVAILLILMIGPMDYFSHGYFCDDEISNEAVESYNIGYFDLKDGEYIGMFVPQKTHFAGFEINIMNQPWDNTGLLIVQIVDKNGKVLDTIESDLSDIKENAWYKIYSKVSLKKGEVYAVRINAQNCATYPWIQLVDDKCLPEETTEGNILMGYAYRQSTFDIGEKVLLSLLIIALLCILLGVGLDTQSKIFIHKFGLFLLMLVTLAWNYMFNSFDNQNENFTDFQADSENLVSGPIAAEHNGMWDSESYGLARYSDVTGTVWKYNPQFLSDENWSSGYSKTEAAILLTTSQYSRDRAQIGNSIRFENGMILKITNVEITDSYTKIVFNFDGILNEMECGSLEKIVFLDENGAELDTGSFWKYTSQYGLQGKIFGCIAKKFDYEHAIEYLNLVCCILTSAVFVIITLLIRKKYNVLMAGCFYFTFLLSPWIVNFARNLYWVEFTWFLPMAVGIFCTWKINSKKCRVASYIAAAVTVWIKSLCGYEYISTIMMGLIAFLLVDLIIALVQRDNQKVKLFFRTSLIIGIMALIGFMLAICIHAYYKGEGDIILGIKVIIVNDVLRRTSGANLNDLVSLTGREADAQVASIWETLCLYFHFKTEIITGITGNLFPLLCFIPIIIFACEYKMKKINVENAAMYVVFFVTSVSWYMLAKSHSYVHVHMNYVLWYFGFVQICLYIIISKILENLISTKNKMN